MGLLAAMAAVVTGAATETFWRSHGLKPSVPDSPTLWAIQRSRANGRAFGPPFDGSASGRSLSNSEATARTGAPVVLLGASRMHLGFDVALCRQRLPGRPICQLALPGTPPWAALGSLADDPDFPPPVGPADDSRHDGTQTADATAIALISVSMQHLTTSQLSAGSAYPRRWRRGVSVKETFESALTTTLHRQFAVTAPEANPQAILSRIRQGRGVVPAFRRTMRADRAAWLTATRPDPAFLKKQAVLVRSILGFPHAPADRASAVALLARQIATLQQRGVRVVLIGFPTGGDLAEAERRRFPRAADDGWDRLIVELQPDAAIHHADLPSAGTFHCPDWSHLDAASAARFTAEVLDELRCLGLLPAPIVRSAETAAGPSSGQPIVRSEVRESSPRRRPIACKRPEPNYFRPPRAIVCIGTASLVRPPDGSSDFPLSYLK
ncbi:MAG: hypothetical protein AAF907_10400 [Planctomycetota bacterium]